jgi:HAD superfamily hydrolase (TIGR01509 family)
MLDWTPSAVVFDCDGLLVDTEPCWTIAETELFARHGLQFGPSYKAQLIGKSIGAAAGVMAALFGEPDNAVGIEAELLTMVAQVVTAQADAMPGAAELVSLIGNLLPIAVASNSPRILLNAALSRGGFTETFPVSIAADEISQPKPDPEMYTVACQRLGADPATVLAFEDSMTGVRSARAAGVRIVGVPTLLHEALPADLVMTSLAAPDLLAWIRRWDTVAKAN